MTQYAMMAIENIHGGVARGDVTIPEAKEIAEAEGVTGFLLVPEEYPGPENNGGKLAYKVDEDGEYQPITLAEWNAEYIETLDEP